jgi:hypothetical protein
MHMLVAEAVEKTKIHHTQEHLAKAELVAVVEVRVHVQTV